MWCLPVCVVLLCVRSVFSARVHTSLGELQGSSYFTTTGREIYTFLGVPYARPPVGKHKFEEPKPAKNWTGIWLATDYRSSCIQLNFLDTSQIIGNEDCLYLNVFTPTLVYASKLPVLVYIHGGAFMGGGSALFDKSFLLENHNIVLVTLNYRLGPFGFLSTQDDVVPGNNGLKDQVMALRWVQDNIAVFGGDNTRVTIAGSSAGGASVHYHYLSHLSQGLFAKGISSSGSALVPWALTEEPLQKAKMLADSVGCPTKATDVMIMCLKYRPSDQILLKIEPLFIPWPLSPLAPFGPVIEKSTKSAPFLREPPYQLLTQGYVHDKPWLTSLTTEEGVLPSSLFIDREDLLQKLNDGWVDVAPHLLDFNYTCKYDQLVRVSNKIKTFYLGNKSISVKTHHNFIKMVGDRLFNNGMSLAARIQASVTESSVFFYKFGYRGETRASNMFFKTKRDYGVGHFDDMYFIFPVSSSLNSKNQADKLMVDFMTRMWASFIDTGRPASYEGVQWDPLPQHSNRTQNLSHLLIKSINQTEMTADEDYGNYKFWKSLDLNENIENFDTLIQKKDEL